MSAVESAQDSNSVSEDTMASSTKHIDKARSRYPYCIVWTPLPMITWFIPIIGMSDRSRRDSHSIEMACEVVLTFDVQLIVLILLARDQGRHGPVCTRSTKETPQRPSRPEIVMEAIFRRTLPEVTATQSYTAFSCRVKGRPLGQFRCLEVRLWATIDSDQTR